MRKKHNSSGSSSKSEDLSKDKQYLKTVMTNIDSFFKLYNISNFKQFCDLFPKGHLKDIQDLIIKFVKSNDITICNIRTRIIKKSNYNELDKIISLLIFMYQEKFTYFLKESNSNLFANCNKDNLIQDINTKADKLRGIHSIFQNTQNFDDDDLYSPNFLSECDNCYFKE